MKNMKKLGVLVGLVVVVAIVIGAFCTGRVETGFTGVVTTFGKVSDKTLESG